MLEHGIDVHALEDYAIRISCQNGYYEIAKMLIEYGADIHVNKDIAFIKSAFYGHYNIVKLLLGTGIDTSAFDLALFWASDNNYYDIVKLIIESSTNIHKEYDRGFINANAVMNGNCDIVKLFIEYGPISIRIMIGFCYMARGKGITMSLNY